MGDEFGYQRLHLSLLFSRLVGHEFSGFNAIYVSHFELVHGISLKLDHVKLTLARTSHKLTICILIYFNVIGRGRDTHECAGTCGFGPGEPGPTAQRVHGECPGAGDDGEEGVRGRERQGRPEGR